MDRNTKTKRKQFSTVSKENEEKNSSESHIELDSRLLSALLTVSIDIFCPCRGERKAKCFTLTGLFNTFDILKFCAFRFVSLEVSNLLMLLFSILQGVNRAFPYVSSNEADDIIEVQTPMLFKLVSSKITASLLLLDCHITFACR